MEIQSVKNPEAFWKAGCIVWGVCGVAFMLLGYVADLAHYPITDYVFAMRIVCSVGFGLCAIGVGLFTDWDYL